jgi:hypothetical protein
MKMNLREIEWSDMDVIHLAQNKDQWRDFVKKIMNLMFHKFGGGEVLE